MTTDIEKSFKAKLRNVAKETNRDPADLWQSLVLERFLVRLAQTKHRNHFVLKGGVLLAKYIPIGRETKDLDFLALKISNNIENLKVIFAEIAAIDTGDGFTFQEVEVNELNHPHLAYAGVEVAIMAYYGKTRFRVTIDIGFGDTVRPIDKQLPLTSYSKGALFEEQVRLLCYPQEFIFAEKLETVVYRAGANSRMKDFHDLYTMTTNQGSLSVPHLIEIIPLVFRHRETPIALPVTFTDAQISQLQSYWTGYLKSMREENSRNLPREISIILTKLHEWIEDHLK